MTLATIGTLPSTARDLRRSTSYMRPMLAGLLGVILMLGALGSWAVLAPLEGAVVAHGALVAWGLNKKIQHLEGGIVSEILVQEGDTVSAGDLLVRLDTTAAEAEWQKLAAELNTSRAREAKLQAERDDAEAIIYPDSLLAVERTSPDIAALISDQNREFEASRNRRSAELGILEKKIDSQKAEISGYELQRAATQDQIDLVDDELKSLEGLWDKGLVVQQRYFGLKRAGSELRGKLGELEGSIGRVEQGILENRMEIERVKNETVETAAKDLVALRVDIGKLINNMTATRDVLDRSEIRAPMDGAIVSLNVNTIGEVLSPGGAVAELLPTPADLMLQAKLRPEDIDRVHVGQTARVTISALPDTQSQPLEAEVLYISADSYEDEATREIYFTARVGNIKIPDGASYKRLYAGMQAESFITTEQRSFFDYLVEPIIRSYNRGLREE